mmetsp:Transcript_4648/g.12376  ORF Transcript_4648/g.12376 Transcript_4648/m.12376 type:complete len:236 (-) Transcript_4648:324-1031(-)
MTRSNISCIFSCTWCFFAHASTCLRTLGNSDMFLSAPMASRTVDASELGSKSSSMRTSAQGSDWNLPSLLIVIAITQPALSRRTVGVPWRTCCGRISRQPSRMAPSLPCGVLDRFHSACRPVSSTLRSRCDGAITFASFGTMSASRASSTPRSSRSRLASDAIDAETTALLASSSALVSLPTRPPAAISAEQPSRLEDIDSSADAPAERTPASLSPRALPSTERAPASAVAMRPW